ncbi:hypothetical protein [Undibacterium sp. Ji49W]|uniref:tetratricopeptide repeat protein n=1 Tax=Undibacterium sp. Ji49W TaxID=3413040 RepID=UPI003BF066BC
MNSTSTIAEESRLDRLQSYLLEDPENDVLRADIFDVALGLRKFELAQEQVDFFGDCSNNVFWGNRQALLYLSKKDYLTAESFLKTLLDNCEYSPNLGYNLSFALYAQGKFEQANSYLEVLIEKQNLLQVPQAMILWMRCQQKIGDLDRILDTFSIHSGDLAFPMEAWGVASLVAIDSDRPDLAKRWAEHALKVDPRQRESLVAVGTLALSDQDVDAAKKTLKYCLDLYPGDGRAWSALGFTLMLESSFSEAQLALQRAAASMPSHIGTWHALGWCNLLLGDLPASQTCFEKALELDRNFGESHGGMAVILAVQGQKMLANEYIERALRLDNRNVSAQYAQALLSGELKNKESFSLMARRVLGRNSSLVRKSLLDDVLKRIDH